MKTTWNRAVSNKQNGSATDSRYCWRTTSLHFRAVPASSCRVELKVIPGASRDEVVGENGGVIRVKLRAPPVDGRANEALLEFLAERLGLRSSSLRLVTGATSRRKLVAIAGLSLAEVRQRLLSPA